MQIGSFSLIKELNTSLILKTIRNNKDISRSDIAKLTGLTPATVTNITSKLINYKIIAETKCGVSNGGRKPVILEFNHSYYNVIGIVISKHKISVSLTDLNANLISQEIEKISEDISTDEIIDIIVKIIEKIIKRSSNRILGIGISMVGLVDEKKGICVFSDYFGWENFNIKEELQRRFGLPVFVNNDVNALTLGERFFGSAKNSSDFALLYIGYGIGATLVSNGNIYRGASNYSFEIGHITMDINGPLCDCGNHGCFQSLASEKALYKQIKEKKYDEKYFKGEKILLDNVLEKVKNGNNELKSLIKNQAFYIGIGLANFINILNPSLLIVNGYPSKAGELMIPDILKIAKEKALKYLTNDVEIIFSNLETNESYKGAVALFISEFLDNPEMFFEV